MLLRTRFFLLLLALSATVAVHVGATVWALVTLERELSWPLKSVAEVMHPLAEIKRSVGTLHNRLPIPDGGDLAAIGPRDGGKSRSAAEADVAQAARQAEAAFARLRRSDYAVLRSGPNMLRNLEGRVALALDQSRDAIAGDAAALADARTSLFNLHEIIEATEGKILDDGKLAVEYGGRLRRTIVLIALLAVVPLLPAAWLAVRIVRRGVLEPVSHLRVATVRLGAGDFSHRVPVRGRDELAALSAEVNHMAQTIARMHDERVDRERLAAIGEMVRRIVHNLRNPLAGIRSLAEITRQDVGHDDLLRENQDRIIGTVDRFERWLGELLTATRPLDVEAHPCEVVPWLRAVIDGQRSTAEGRSIRLDAQLSAAPATASFDPRHLEQALVALLSNALDASPTGSTVVVSAVAEPEGTWQVRVADQGPGVPLELREQVFRPYFTTKREGTGIGLAVVRQVVEQHGGKVWIEDAPGGVGAVFVVRMPVAGPPSRPEKTGTET